MADCLKRDWRILLPVLVFACLALLGLYAGSSGAILVGVGGLTLNALIAIHSNYGWRKLAEEIANATR